MKIIISTEKGTIEMKPVKEVLSLKKEQVYKFLDGVRDALKHLNLETKQSSKLRRTNDKQRDG